MKWGSLLAIVILFPFTVSAQIVISEIMYDLPQGSDSGREWIEILNQGTTPTEITALRLFENNTNHKITAAGADTLSPGGYAVIADNASDFKSDWPQFSGLLFDSTFSLSNSGETLALKDASSTVLDTISYQSSLGAAGDGNSLNRELGASTFVPKRPTPGTAMASDAIIPPPEAVTPPKSSKKSSTKSQSAAVGSLTMPSVATSDVSDETSVSPESQEQSNGHIWWIAAAGIAALAGGSILFAQKYAKEEWDISEE